VRSTRFGVALLQALDLHRRRRLGSSDAFLAGAEAAGRVRLAESRGRRCIARAVGELICERYSTGRLCCCWPGGIVVGMALPDLTRREFVHLTETGNGRAAYVLSKEAFRWNDCLALAFSS
jgi:hypothetical protein